MASISAIMWQTQNVLHKKPQVVPGTLLLLASSLVVYQHMTSPTEDGGIKRFLAMILVQMLPLVALEMKILSCADPVGLFCKFATPVTLQHAFFLGVRLVNAQHDLTCLMIAVAGFVGAVAAIYKGYRQSFMNIIHCSQVWGLITLCLGAAMCTVSLEDYLKPEWKAPMTWERFFEVAFETASQYIEITAFVPAVWIIFREDQSAGRVQIESPDTKRIATTFFMFLVGFYVTEDIMSALEAFQYGILTCALAHTAHFCLLLDFAFYILAHIYNPEKLVGELRRWLPVDCYHEV